MPTNYRVLIDLACLDQLPRSGRKRDNVIGYCKSLLEAHHLGGHFQITDPDTRKEYEVAIIDGFIITWWADHPVKRIVVIDIRPAKNLS